MNRKVITIFLLIVMTFSLLSCGSEKEVIEPKSFEYKETAIVFSGNVMHHFEEYQSFDLNFSEQDKIYIIGWGEIGSAPFLKMYLRRLEQETEKMNISNELFKEFDVYGGDLVLDNENNLFVSNYVSGKFFAFDSVGNLINSINIIEKMYHYLMNQESSNYLMGYYTENDYVYILVRETAIDIDTKISSLQKFNWRTGEYISSFVLDDITNFSFYDGLLYVFTESGIEEIDMSGNIVKKVNFPENNVMATDCEPDNYGYSWLKQNKSLLYVENGNIYYCNANGVYCAKKNENELKLIMPAENSELIKGDYHLLNLGVNDGKIYIMAKTNSETQWPGYLYMYEK